MECAQPRCQLYVALYRFSEGANGSLPDGPCQCELSIVSFISNMEFISTIVNHVDCINDPLLSSSGCCSRVRYPSVSRPTTRCNHQRIRYGRFIVAACSSGIFRRLALERTPTPGKIRLSWLWSLGGKLRKYRTHWTLTRATSIWRSCICVGSTYTSGCLSERFFFPSLLGSLTAC